VPRPDFARTFDGFRKRFVSEEDCWRYLVASRWPEGFRCPACGSDEAWTLPRRALFEFRSCRHQASVTAGTILHRTRLSLSSWFAAAYLVTTHTPGFSALQLQRQLGLSRYETAFVMLHKLRRAMRRPERDRIAGTVEVDEASIGGVDSRQKGGRQRAGNKSIVVGAVAVEGQRAGRLRLAVVPDLTAASLGGFVAAASWRRRSSPAASS
jgi:uncharacterized protein YchJ